MSIIKNDLKDDIKNIDKVMKRNIQKYGKTLLTNSKQRAPRLSGDLRASGKVETKTHPNYYKTSVSYGEGIEYAERRYYENDAHEETKQWMDKELQQNEKMYDDIIVRGLGD